MKAKHGYDAAAERRKVREELFLLKSQQAKIERERKAALNEEARKAKKEAREKKEGEKAIVREEANQVKEEARKKKEGEKAARKAEKIRRRLEKQKEREKEREKKVRLRAKKQQERIEKARVEEEACQKKKEERKKEQEEKKAAKQRKGGKVVPFDFNRDIIGGALYCGKCNRVFSTDSERDQHERRHDDPKNFNCSKCYKSFKKMDNKVMHELHCGGGVSEPRAVTRDQDEEDEEEFSMTSALNDAVKTYRLKFAPGIVNLNQRLTKAMMEASDQLFTIQRSNKNVKYYVSLHCTFYKTTDPDILTVPPVVFNSGTSLLLPSSNVKDQMKINYQNILQGIENYEKDGSGWNLLRLEMMDINTVRYKPFQR